MTRLTSEYIKDVPTHGADLDSTIEAATGRKLRQLALEAAGLDDDTDLSVFTAAVVPITSGLGVIGGFAQSIDAILTRLGIDSHVTSDTDVKGFSEATLSGADLVFMADDKMFVAYNTRERKFISNHYGTALGYAYILCRSSEGVRGKKVLVIGAGFVGSRSARILRDYGADVTITDIIPEKADMVASELGIRSEHDVESAVSEHMYILNAAPASFPGSIMRPGVIISTSGVPHYFDEEAWSKARAIVHDPLEIGTAFMATCSAAFSIRGEGESR